jgi:NADH-quinone oxidoreductase subunit N
MWVLLPVAIMAAGGIATLLIGAMAKRGAVGTALSFTALGTTAVAAFATAAAWTATASVAGGALVTGPFATFLALVVLAGTGLALLYSEGYADSMGFAVGEYFGLILIAGSGMLYLVAANDLITIFIAFEIMSLSVYALVASDRKRRAGSEGAMKYFVLGAFSSGILLYGMALLYGATGTIFLNEMGAVNVAPTLKLLGVGLCVIGFAFKVGAVPFHAWVPDAYQGAPASVTGFMAVAVKAAGFAVLIRMLFASGLVGMGALGSAGNALEETLGQHHLLLTNVLWVLAMATMIVGNFLALAQTNLKRLLAYSGVSHTGYILLGLVAAMRLPTEGVTAVCYYLAAYTAMTLGAFAVLVMLAGRGRDLGEVDELAGLGKRRPMTALAMTICLVSLVGMPPTAGFIGKLWLFKAGIDAGFTGLVIVAAISTMVSIYYYLRPVVVMYTGHGPDEPVEAHATGQFVLAVATVATLLVGLMPSGIYEYARKGVEAFLAVG